jgi:hypothetical protein
LPGIQGKHRCALEMVLAILINCCPCS